MRVAVHRVMATTRSVSAGPALYRAAPQHEWQANDEDRQQRQHGQHADEAALMRQILGPVRSGFGNSSGSNKGREESRGGDLVAALTRQTLALTKQVASLQDSIVRRDAMLQEQGATIEALRTRPATPALADDELVNELTAVRQENAQLRAQVYEMESFLNDYGLMWVGEPSPRPSPRPSTAQVEDEDTAASADAEIVSDKQASTTLPVPMDVLQSRVRDLNALASGDTEMITLRDGTRTFAPKKGVVVTMLSDGFRVGNGPARSYGHPSSLQFFQDIVDGYFPWEFHESHPNGVELVIQDDTVHASIGGFHAPGNVLGRPATSLEDRVHGVTTVTPQAKAKQGESADAFLARLPASVVRNGRVINIRGDVASLVGRRVSSAGENVRIVETDALHQLCEDAGAGASAPSQVTTLRVRGCGQEVLLFKLAFTDTIAVLRAHLLQHAPSVNHSVEIRTLYPTRILDQDQETMEAAGLVPNANVNVVFRDRDHE